MPSHQLRVKDVEITSLQGERATAAIGLENVPRATYGFVGSENTASSPL